MRAVVYHGPGQKQWEEVADPKITDDGDAIVRVDATTICGTDLHILKGDVPAVTPGRILGHEAVGTVMETGPGVRSVPVLPSRPVRTVYRGRRLDFRTPDRRGAGGVRAGAFR